METYPLPSLSLEQAKQLQFKIVDAVTRHFDGLEVLNLGDLGVVKGNGKPHWTQKAERVIADVFDAPAALLVRGAGTGALRWGLHAMLEHGGTLLVHDAPVYPTTKTSLELMGVRLIKADFNDADALAQILRQSAGDIDGVLVQHTRQKIDDRYDFAAVVRQIKEALPNTPILTDDNYAALKVPAIGCQAGADLSSFSCFKTLGPAGIGLLVGSEEYVGRAAAQQYSGGSQVQGYEAMEALRGLIYAPVALAIQAEVGQQIVDRLNAGELPGVCAAFLANAQSKVILVEFEQPIAAQLMEHSFRFGAAAHPVGSESIYEFAPMIYRISGTFRAQDPRLEHRMIRINPMRSGADTVLRILKQSMDAIRKEEGSFVS